MLSDATVLIAVVAAPMLVGLTAFGLRGRGADLLGRLGVLASGAGFVTAVGLAAGILGGRGVTALDGWPISLAADELSVALLLLVFGISTVVQAFGSRYLAGDSRRYWFTAGAGMLTAASAALALAATLVTLALAWTLAGVALCLLLATYWQLPPAREGVRRTVVAFLIGDAALWAAVGVITARAGNVTLDGLAVQELGGPQAAVVAVLVVCAALSRSAQIPFHRWLPATLAAPTPVSALLHAGVVNAGGILLIRLSPLSTVGVAVVVTLIAGAATMAYASVISLVKPDVKGALAYSTMAQMGFMTFTVGLGLWAAAVVHLVAHGCYKATLFLGSGSAVAYRRRAASVPTAPQQSGHTRATNLAAAVLLPLTALSAGALVVPGVTEHGSGMALLLFAWVTGAAATWGWLTRRAHTFALLSAALVALPTAIAYLAVVSSLTDYLAPALPAETLSARAVTTIVAAAVLMLAGFSVLRWSKTRPGLHRALYAHALVAGYPNPPMRGVRP
ncbi:proton-conducting transporter membrane subunit [Mycobacterium sp. SMC-4]|uniref:proton-conducting transporter transmembrane domain-containing protein n=1 Tax=Mycobacterium sp. SMC-4 TaxID=2857059 RepID=UPI0021B2EA86|nr:proton-conducting transporter membrane subunit [Mycobacterium sp. SMC-4]UXA18736.1 hypothetical protein KXD98_03260 [Mycobacterium sp. SMC-4]